METALNSREKPEFIYESDADASFLVIRCGAEIPEYQVSMLEHNNISCVIPLNVVRKEGINHFYYNITSKISLALFLKRKKLSREQFLKFLINVVSTINIASGYLLSSSNFILDAAYIYINPENLEPALVYVPVLLEDGWGVPIQDFVSGLLMQHINSEGFEGENLVQRILAAVNSQQFYVKGFLNLLNELLYGRRAPDGNAEGPNSDETLRNGNSGNKLLYNRAADEKMTVNKISGNRTAGSITSGNRTAGSKPVLNKPAANRPEINIPAENKISINARSPAGQREKALKVKEWEMKSAENSGDGSRNMWLAILAALVQILIGFAIYSLRDFLDNIGGNPAVTYAAVIMIVIAVEFLLFKKIKDSGFITFEKGNQSSMKSEQDKDDVTGISGTYNASGAPDCNADDVFYTAENSGKTENKAPAEAASISNKTELLSSRINRTPVLKSRDRQGIMDDIYIDKDDFIIGRLEGHADYVLKNNAVGKLHVQLIRRDGAFFVRDLNSVNGTYINDIRIESNKEYEIKENDILRIANCEYGFYGGYGYDRKD